MAPADSNDAPDLFRLFAREEVFSFRGQQIKATVEPLRPGELQQVIDAEKGDAENPFDDFLTRRVSNVTVGGRPVDPLALVPFPGLVGRLLGLATRDEVRDADSEDVLVAAIKRREMEAPGAGVRWAAAEIRKLQLANGLGAGNG